MVQRPETEKPTFSRSVLGSAKFLLQNRAIQRKAEKPAFLRSALKNTLRNLLKNCAIGPLCITNQPLYLSYAAWRPEVTLYVSAGVDVSSFVFVASRASLNS